MCTIGRGKHAMQRTPANGGFDYSHCHRPAPRYTVVGHHNKLENEPWR